MVSERTLSRAEEWKPVVGWEGIYEVSSLGRVRSLPRFRVPSARILKGCKKSEGYIVVNLCSRGRKSCLTYVHILVAEAFLGIPEGREVNHKNGQPGNNRLSNLEVITHQENMLHCVRIGLRKSAKLNPDKVRTILSLRGKIKNREIAERFGVSLNTIEDIFYKGNWLHAI